MHNNWKKVMCVILSVLMIITMYSGTSLTLPGIYENVNLENVYAQPDIEEITEAGTEGQERTGTEENTQSDTEVSEDSEMSSEESLPEESSEESSDAEAVEPTDTQMTEDNGTEQTEDNDTEESTKTDVETNEEESTDAESSYDAALFGLDDAEAGTLQYQINEIKNTENAAGEIRLDKDYEESIIIPDGVTVTIDLNGYAIKAPEADASYIANHIIVYGALVIKDESEGQSGKVYSNGTTNMRAITIAGGGSVTLESGEISGYCFDGSGAGVNVEKNGTFIMNGGQIKENQSALYGGGIYAYAPSDLSLNGGEISGNTAQYGGGVSIYLINKTEKSYIVNDVAIRENTALADGGGLYAEGPIKLEVNNGICSKNTAAENGGGFCFKDMAYVTFAGAAEMSENTADTGTGGGFAFLAEGSSLLMENGMVINNHAGTNGGGVGFLENSNPNAVSSFTMENGLIGNNTADKKGGGIYGCIRSNITINNGSINENKAGEYGGGVCVDSVNGKSGCFTMKGGEVSGNTLTSDTSTRYGGGLFAGAYSDVVLSGGKMNDNKNAYYGSGVYINNNSRIKLEGDIEISGNKTDANNATACGGGIYVSASSELTMTGGTISENSGEGGLRGGGLYLMNGVDAQISGGKIRGNISNGEGGGIYCYNDTTKLTIDGTTEISGNRSEGGSSNFPRGGGIFSGTVTIKGNAQIIENFANGEGGGIYNTSSLVVEGNPIISSNSANSNGGGIAVIGGNSKINFTMTGGALENNSSASNGGGIYLMNNNDVSVISGNVAIKNNKANNGGGIFVRADNNNRKCCLHIEENVEITDNTAANSGGGVYVDTRSRIVVEKAEITSNSANRGGGIYSNIETWNMFPDGGKYTIEVIGDGDVSDNMADSGRDIFINASRVSINNSNLYRPSVKAGGRWINELEYKNEDGIDTWNEVQDKTQSKNFAYTYINGMEEVAAIGSITYPSVQAAVDAVLNKTVQDSEIVMLKDSREDVTIYDDTIITLDLNGKSLKGAAGSVVTVEENAKLTIKDSSKENSGKICQGKGTLMPDNRLYGGGLFVKGECILENGTICNNSAFWGAAIYLAEGSKVTMNGGILEKNIVGYANAAVVNVCHDLSSDSNYKAEFNVTGGEIRNNTGGGIFVSGYSQINISGGKISGNVKSSNGGGIYIQNNAKLYITGGEITGNSASANGGSIYVNNANNEVYISNCTIRENTALYGGGIYINQGKLHIGKGTVITDNTASTGSGGGLFVNNILYAQLYMSGGQIYGNSAYNASDDLFMGEGSYFCNEDNESTGKDFRAADSMEVAGIDCWYDDKTDTYYLADTKAETGENVKSISDMFGADKDRISQALYLKAVSKTEERKAVAQIEEKKYFSLKSAVAAADKYEGAVTIELLADITESADFVSNTADITIDLKGHTITAPKKTTRLFYVNGGTLTIDDTSADKAGKLVPEATGDSINTRAVYIDCGSFTLKNGTIDGFQVTGNNNNGGAIYAAGGKNIGTDSAPVYMSSVVKIEGGLITNCHTDAAGGAVYIMSLNNKKYKSSLYMNDGTISNCTAANGGAIYFNANTSPRQNDIESVFHITGGTIRDNTASGDGGGIYFSGFNDNNSGHKTKDDVQIYGVTISGNRAANGGAIAANNPGNADEGYPAFILGKAGKQTVIRDNTATSNSGGVRIVSNGNTNPTNVIMTNVDIINNTSDNSSGAVNITVDKLMMTDCRITNNQSETAGAGVINASELKMDTCDISYNKMKGSNLNSGGLEIYSNNLNPDGTFLINNCNFSRNQGNCGGGLYIGVQKDVRIENSIFSYNIAKNQGGGGIVITGTGQREITLKNCTVSNNKANYGGGVGLYSNTATTNLTLTVEDTKIAENETTYGDGGGIYFTHSNIANQVNTLTLKGKTEISGNVPAAGRTGGGIICMNSNLNIGDGVEIKNNRAAAGGGVSFQIVNAANFSRDKLPKFRMTGGSISNNIATNNGGGLDFYNGTSNPADFDTIAELSGGQIDANVAGNGAGIYCRYTYGHTGIIRLMITGTAITNNKASGSGGAIYHSGGLFNTKDYSETIISGDTLITGNTASNYGGGIFIDYRNEKLTLEGGRIYENHASLGQDIYVNYNQTISNTGDNKRPVMNLMKASDMFASSGDMRALGWLDEDTGKVYENQSIQFNPCGKVYPITLSYATNKIVAVVDGTAYTSVQDAVDAISHTSDKSGTVTMVAHSVESVTIPTGVDVKLNLNGYTLKGSGNSAITCMGTLGIYDTHETIQVEDVTYVSGENIGKITGTASETGGGICIDGGMVTMYAGEISECAVGLNASDNSKGGAAVGIKSGRFVLDGGKICDNRAAYGSAVMLLSPAAEFEMISGEISENKSTRIGDINRGYGAIYNNGGIVNIAGGVIKNNSAVAGGAIYNNSGAAYISGNAVISNNTATQRGGGIYVGGGAVNIGKAYISGNAVTGAKSADVGSANGVTTSAGGGIYVHAGTLNITDGALIQSNSAVRGGGIYQNTGTVTVMGGTITKNKAQMGGGLAQNPLPNNSTTRMAVVQGKIYGNISTTAAGNDFYSAYEGTEDYNRYITRNLIPRLTLLAANDMGLSQYNVWKDDAYEGGNRTGVQIGEGHYITARLNQVNNVQLTADYYDTEIIKTLDTHFKVETLKIENINLNAEVIDGMIDGTNFFDDGRKVNGVQYDDAALKEKTAEDLLKEGKAVERSGQTYMYNGTEYAYIEYNGQLYEREQAVLWWPGDDSGDSNSIVRTFDTVVYSLTSAVNSDGDSEYEPPYTYHLWLKAVLPCSSDEAEFSDVEAMGLESYTITKEKIDGRDVQILRGYWEQNTTQRAESVTKTATVSVHGMKNGDTLKPEFETRIEGNEQSEAYHAACSSKTLTVSAAPKYNIALAYNSELNYTGYFDMAAGVEVSEEDAKDNPNVVYGTMLGYGITAELYNEPSGKGLKGIELPKDELEFDLSLKGSVFADGVLLTDTAYQSAPYIWAYKPNDNNMYGKPLNGMGYTHNMNWNDEDDQKKTTYYAYDAAPYNSGGGSKACYNGGSWLLQGSQPKEDDKETKVHVKVSGYQFNNDNNPVQNSDGITSSQLNSSAVKAFSAGYVQVLFPMDLDNDNLNGYIQISMDTAVSGLDIISVSDQLPEEVESASGLATEEAVKRDLDSMNEYYGYDESEQLKENKIAVNERRYADNYINQVASLYIYHGSRGNVINKNNYFLSNDRNMLTDDNGKGDTPLNSTVYMSGGAVFSSDSYHTDDKNNDSDHYMYDDPMYDTQYFNTIEYNYMTSVNLLQKFDADAFTPVGTSPVINERYVLKGQNNTIHDGAFVIRTSEGPTEWSESATYSYDLTVLYAAKPDGTNWNKTDVSASYDAAEGSYDDGGVADMDKYREENLLYFKTLDDLYAYFGGEENGKCVAILYEFRNCCIRTGRSITADAAMNVTGDFEKTGKTYCTTNDVRGWITYRPHYKIYYANNTVDEHTYGFNWTDMEYANEQNGIKPYGAALDTGSDIEALPAYTEDGKYPVALRCDNDGYIKTQYQNGTKIPGTHTGVIRGNTLLLYTLNTSIEIGVTKLIEGSNSPKLDYNISNGEREVSYQVTPHIDIASTAKKTPLVENGTQSTNIKLELTLPKYLTYQDGSISFHYEDSGYQEGELNWNIEVIGDGEGQKILLNTYVSDIDLELPKIEFDCIIGDVKNPDKDIQKNTSLSVTASIRAEYEEMGLTAAEAHMDTATINVKIENRNGITKGVEKRITELGEDIIYTLSYTNNTENNTIIELGDVLPYNGDGRGSEFYGGYRIKDISVEFTDTESFNEFIKSGKMKYLEKQTYSSMSGEQNVLLDKFVDNGTGLRFKENESAGENVVNMEVPDNVIQYAYDESGNPVKSGIALYGYFPVIFGRQRFTITVVMSPETSEGNLIESGNRDIPTTQIGDCLYRNTFFYRIPGEGGGTSVTSNEVEVRTVNRIVSGVVWMDQDHDGIYYSKDIADKLTGDEDREERLVEYPLEGIDVYLHYAKKNGDEVIAEPDLGIPVKDVLGNTVLPVVTDKEGKYRFENLLPGDYIITFQDDNDNYNYVLPDSNGYQPLPFDKLSVTTDERKNLNNGNRSEACYETNDSLKEAKLYTTIHLPAKEDIRMSPYVSPNWNCGLYYIDMTLEKEWRNMVEGIPKGTSIDFTVIGDTDAEAGKSEKEHIYDSVCTMKLNDDGGVSGTYAGKAIAVTVEEQKPVYTWKLAQSLALQAETEKGKIEYNVNEISIKDADGQDVSSYFDILPVEKTVDKTSGRTIYTAVNEQLLGSVTIRKKANSGENLEGAEFSLYQTFHKLEDDAFYAADEGVGTEYQQAYKTVTTSLQYKIMLGSDVSNLDGYDEKSNRLTVDGRDYIVHKEHTGDDITYYYYTDIVPENTDNVQQEAVAVFENLPLYGSSGKLYYTMRETKVPTGYLSLADFKSLTCMDLKDGYGSTRDICFVVENSKMMKLPVTGGSGMSTVVILGTVMILLGGIYILLMAYKRKMAKADNLK